MKDINGDKLEFGDRVRYLDDYNQIEYEFTIEVVDSDGWIWGSDIPEEHRWCYESQNFHNPNACLKIHRNKWGNSRLEFKFITW